MEQPLKNATDFITLPEIKRRFAAHLLVLLFVLLGFFFGGIFLSGSYSAKARLVVQLGDIRVQRMDVSTESILYFFTQEPRLAGEINEKHVEMYNLLVEAAQNDRTFSDDVDRIKTLTATERRIFNTLLATMQYRGFNGKEGEFRNFIALDDSLRPVLKDMMQAADGSLGVNLHYDFSAELANVNLGFFLYSRSVLESPEPEVIRKRSALVVEQIEDILSHVPERTPRQVARDAAVRLLLNKQQIFKRVVGYDMQIYTNMRSLAETAKGTDALLESVYAAVQTRMIFVRNMAFVLLGGFLCFIVGVVVTFSRFIHHTANYSLRQDVRLAELASEAKNAFLTNISHEIRSPLNAVLGLDELIIRESNESRVVDYALSIQRSGKTLLSLINDILDFSKIEAGKIEILTAEYDVPALVGDLYNMIAPRAAEKHLAFQIHVAEDLPRLLIGDEMRIKQCALNILTNGVKYTNEGSVTLSIDWKVADEDALRIPGAKIILVVRVTDTGIGIKEADMPKLFSAFERIEERRNRTIEGTGLGMAIVQNLLTLMEAKLDVQSEYGKGSVFTMEVPQTVSDWTGVGPETAEVYKKPLPRVAVPFDSFTAPDARILVVDDMEVNLTVVKGLLKPTLIQVDTALSGHEALTLVTQNRYDLIFLDHRMPVMDGIETLRFMQTLDTNLNKDVPVIALTANAVSGARELYLKEGFVDYMSKPIDIVRMEKALREYIPQNMMQVADPQALQEAVPEELSLAEDIELSEALANCGGPAVLKPVLLEYYNSIESKAAAIEKAFAAGDWKNYTVFVHGVKSASRLIAAASLSALAQRLEHCGDILQGTVPGEASAMEAALAEIQAKTPALLELYRGYREKLAAFAAAVEEAGQVAADGSEKPLLERDMYRRALENIRECMQISDFTLADQIIDMLDGYRMEGPLADHYKTVKAAVTAVDPARVIAAVDGEKEL